jgi:hypothetical protein
VNEPTVAILDDPLTHCDIGRLNKMRAILRRAAEGDSKLTPPAGQLQIIVLTCHPEWFRPPSPTSSAKKPCKPSLQTQTGWAYNPWRQKAGKGAIFLP